MWVALQEEQQYVCIGALHGWHCNSPMHQCDPSTIFGKVKVSERFKNHGCNVQEWRTTPSQVQYGQVMTVTKEPCKGMRRRAVSEHADAHCEWSSPHPFQEEQRRFDFEKSMGTFVHY